MLLGRTPEIKVLRDVVEQARAGGGAALVIRGEPGGCHACCECS